MEFWQWISVSSEEKTNQEMVVLMVAFGKLNKICNWLMRYRLAGQRFAIQILKWIVFEFCRYLFICSPLKKDSSIIFFPYLEMSIQRMRLYFIMHVRMQSYSYLLIPLPKSSPLLVAPSLTSTTSMHFPSYASTSSILNVKLT